MSLAPRDRARRSFVHRELAALGAEFVEVNGAACALTCGAAPEAEGERAREIGVCDLSPLPRAGFKGRETIPWLAAAGVTVSEDDTMAVVQDDGARAARLAPGEVLLLSDVAATSRLIERLAATWSPDPDPGTYPVPRDDTNCWFAISGRHGPEMLAKLCGVDLRPRRFADGRIAQTSVARLNAIVIRGDIGDVTVYHLLTDSAAASYMWSCVLDAMSEFDGAAVGLAALRGLNQGS